MKRCKFFLNILIAGVLASNLGAQLDTIKQNAHLVIFVHGTLKPAQFSFSSLIQVMRDNVNNTFYSKAAQYMRQDPELYFTQAIQERGLKKIDTSLHSPLTTARTIALMYNLQFKQLGKKTKDIFYYTFGWNGLLSATQRYKEAEFFYKELLVLLDQFKGKNITPTIEIIAYSHGANVVFYLPAVRNNNPSYKNNTFQIDKIVALATPIQSETDHLTADHLFKKIYHLYSTEDNIQVMDIFSSQQFFSRRKFASRQHFIVPEHLQQIRIRTTKDIKWRYKATDLKEPHEILSNHKVKLIHKDPGHTEMWNFNWRDCCYWYRNNFPLNPMPVMAFIPTIINAVDKYPAEKHLTFDYAPTENGILLKNKKTKIKKTLGFLTPNIQKDLWNLASKYEPPNTSSEYLKKRVALAMQKAKNDLQINKKYHKPRSRAIAHYMKLIPKEKKIRLARSY